MLTVFHSLTQQVLAWKQGAMRFFSFSLLKLWQWNSNSRGPIQTPDFFCRLRFLAPLRIIGIAFRIPFVTSNMTWNSSLGIRLDRFYLHGPFFSATAQPWSWLEWRRRWRGRLALLLFEPARSLQSIGNAPCVPWSGCEEISELVFDVFTQLWRLKWDSFWQQGARCGKFPLFPWYSAVTLVRDFHLKALLLSTKCPFLLL